MNDININSSSETPSVPNLNTSTPTSTPSSVTSVQDSLAAAEASSISNPNSVFFQLAKPVYLNTWIKYINLSLQDSKEQILSDQSRDVALLKGMRQNSALTAEFLIGLQNTYNEIAQEMEALYEQQQAAQAAAKTAIDNYNDSLDSQHTQDQNRINTMNNATTAYNNATTVYNNSDKGAAATAAYATATTTYNNAISAYSTYVDTTRVNTYDTSKNTLSAALNTYQSSVNSFNATILQINDLRATVGILPLPTMDDAPTIASLTTMPSPPSTSNPIALGSAPSVTHVAAVPVPTVPPTSDDLIQQYASAFIDSIVPEMDQVNTFLDQLSRYHDFLRYYLGPRVGKISTLPNSYVDATNKVFLDQSTSTGSGAGVSLSSMIAGLSDINLNRVLSNDIASEAALQANIPLSPHEVDQLRLVNLAILSRGALGSSIPAFSLLSERLAYMDENSPAVDTALAVSYAVQISALASTADQQQAILERLKANNPNTDAAKLEELAASLAAASNLSLGLFALSQLAQKLNLPDLPAQVLSQINTPATSNVLTEASTTTVADILNNPLSASYLKADLFRSLVESSKLDQSIADDIAKSINLKNITSEEDLKASINKQLVNSGIESSQATQLANRAAEFVRNEINSRNLLDTAVQSDHLKQDTLTRELQKEGVNADVAAKVAANISTGSYTSRRELRDGVSGYLVDSGMPLAEARSIATNVVRFNQSGALNPTAISGTELAQNVNAHVTQLTSADLGADKAQKLASTTVDALFHNDATRPMSIVNVISTNINYLNQIDDKTLANTVHEFLKPNYDLYHFNEKIMDPANTLVLSMWSGLMYSSKFKHTESIDIIV